MPDRSSPGRGPRGATRLSLALAAAVAVVAGGCGGGVGSGGSSGPGFLPADVQVDHPSAPYAGASQVKVCASGGGMVYAAWIGVGPTSTPVLFNRSTDGGATWMADDVVLNPSASGSNAPGSLEIAAYTDLGVPGPPANAHVYVAWTEPALSQVRLNSSADSGETWLASDVRADVASSHSRATRICVNGATVNVLWVDDDGSVSLNTSLSAGETWLPQDVRLDSTGGVDPGDVDLCCAGSYVYAIWSDGSSVRFRMSYDNGQNWGVAESRLDSPVAGSMGPSRPRLATTEDGSVAGEPGLEQHVYAVWEVAGPQVSSSGAPAYRDIRATCSHNGGADWTADVDIDSDGPGTGDASDPRISSVVQYDPQTATITARAVVVYADSVGATSADLRTSVTSDGGDTWGVVASPLNAGGAALVGGDASAVCCDGTNVYAAWLDGRNGGGNDVYFNVSTDGGETWSAQDLKLNTTGKASAGLSLGAYGDHVCVGWADAADPSAVRVNASQP